MSKITLDAATAAKLLQAEPVCDLVGPDGADLGLIVPPSLRSEVERLIEERRHALAEADKAFPIERLKELLDNMDEGVPHIEVIKQLGLE